MLGDFSISDITMMACFHRMQDVHLDDLLRDDAVPQIGAYWERLQARPSYQSAVVDWHDEKNGRSVLREVFGDAKSPILAEAQKVLRSLV